jgi:Family of unknown function (DUF6527)
MKLSSKLRKWAHEDQEGLVYWCQGCESHHQIRTKGPTAWGWNGDVEKPTFTPSVLVTYKAVPDAEEEFKEWRTERRCHTFITDGMVQFLGDCTHALAGQTLPLPDLPERST